MEVESAGKSDLFEPKCLGQQVPHSSGVGVGDAISRERGDTAATRHEGCRHFLGSCVFGNMGRECRAGPFPLLAGNGHNKSPVLQGRAALRLLPTAAAHLKALGNSEARAWNIGVKPQSCPDGQGPP